MTGTLDFPGDEPRAPERPAPAPRPPPRRPAGASRTSGWFVGAAALLLLAVIAVGGIGAQGTGG